MAAAKAVVEKVTKPNPPWDGPSTGPKLQSGKTVVYVSADQRNGGARGVAEGMDEAAKLAGWDFRVIDGQGTVSGRSAAMNQAIALKPDAIVLGALDAAEQAALDRGRGEAEDRHRRLAFLRQAGAERHAAGVHQHHHRPAGGGARRRLLRHRRFRTARPASSSSPISVYRIAIAKSDAMAEVIRGCPGCKVLSVEDTPLSDTGTRMGPLTTALLQRFGDEWTYALGINDLYFDFMAPSLASAGIGGDGRPHNVSAGDGSEVAFQRIRANQYQVGTVAEPLRLHGWQLVDELNRAFAGEKASFYVAPAHLFTPANIKADGGPDNVYDPENGYRDAYKKIWGVN